MSARKSKERAAKRLARLSTGEDLAGAKPELAPAPVPAVAVPAPSSLSPEQQRLLNELENIAGDINKLIHRAVLKMMLEGFKAGSASSPK